MSLVWSGLVWLTARPRATAGVRTERERKRTEWAGTAADTTEAGPTGISTTCTLYHVLNRGAVLSRNVRRRQRGLAQCRVASLTAERLMLQGCDKVNPPITQFGHF